jgi:hypothetical protein
MKATDFLYSVQGYFELNGSDAPLTQQQMQKVLKLADSVKKGEGPLEDKAQEVVEYTKGALSAVSKINLNSNDLLKVVTEDLRRKLNDTFIHSVDPSYAGDQNTFNQIHKPDLPMPSTPFNRPPGVRC